MKNGIIVALIAAIAIGSALGAFAATRTIQTEANVEVRVWESVRTGNLYLSTRPEGGEWTTHDDEPLDMSLNDAGSFYQSSFVVVTVPIEVEIEVPDPTEPTEEPTEAPTATPEPEPGTCCEVRGMEDVPAAQERILTAMQEVIRLGNNTYGLTHSGPIVINISFTPSGVLERYKDAFGFRPDELPDECSFQEGEHMFFTPLCRTDTRAIAKEWFARAAGAATVDPSWIGEATLTHFLTKATVGKPPALDEDRSRRALFYEEPGSLKRGRGSEALKITAMLYAIQRYGVTKDWLAFYRRVVAGEDAASAFADAFDESLDEFYTAFETWADNERLLLVTSAYGSCAEAAQALRLQGGTPGVDAGYPDYRVPTERDRDGDGLVCDGYLPGD